MGTIAQKYRKKGIHHIGKEKGKIEGIKIGQEKGKNEIKSKIARKLRDQGLDPKLIALTTGLSVEEISQLK